MYLRPNSEKDQKEEEDTKHVVAMGAYVLSKPAEKEWDTRTKDEGALRHLEIRQGLGEVATR